MGKTVSIYIDDDALKQVKQTNLPLSRAVRNALTEWLRKDAKSEDYAYVEEALFGKMTEKGRKAWEDVRKDRGADRW
jgi:hypothetical protein